MSLLNGKHVLLGVTGGIAAYKAPSLVRRLKALGAEVRVIMTQSACQFVGPLTLQAVSGSAVGTDLFDLKYEERIGHIELARWPDVVLIAPATANLVGKMANGLADDLLSTVLLATTAPIVVAPSMNSMMLEHPAVQRNIKCLQIQKTHIVQPDEGELACQETGPGRLPDPDALIDALLNCLSEKPLSGKNVLVTVGPTRERIDAVRFLTNASSGRMGFAICQVAHHLGAKVTAITGPVHVESSPGIHVIGVESAHEMAQCVDDVIDTADIAVFTAAVADIRPTQKNDAKTSKGDLPDAINIERTRDILKTICDRQERPFCVGFAAETGDVDFRTIEKCRRKGCDLIVGNHVGNGAGFGAEDNTVVIADRDAVLARFGPAPKVEVAQEIWRVVIERI